MSEAILNEIKSLREQSTKQIAALESRNKTLEEQNTHLKKYLEEPAYKGGTGISPGKIFAVARDPKEEGRLGFKSLGHFLKDVADAEKSKNPQPLANRITKGLESLPDYVTKVPSGLSEAVGPDGGFLLAPTYADGILEIMHQQYNILDLTDKYDIAGPSIKVRAVDETSRATGSRRGGVRGYWVDEGATITSSKPKFRLIEMSPHKLAVLSYATEELLADGGQMLEQTVSRGAAEEINFLCNDAIINGTGTGQPLGIVTSAAKVSVAKETGQAAATLVSQNIIKMWSRLHAASRANAVWWINQDVEPQLHQLNLPVGTGGALVYMPPGGLSDSPYGKLYGRPVVPIEQCQTLGTQGDVILADPKQYLSVTRGAINSAVSMHVAFLTDELAYRFTFRVAGGPWWSAPLTPFKGSATQSPFIVLDTRA